MKSLATLLVFLGFAGSAFAGPLTQMTFSGPVGEPISHGQVNHYTPADGVFTVQHDGDTSGGIYVFFNTPEHEHFFLLQLGAPNGETLQVGTYDNALRFLGSNIASPRLSLGADGAGCASSHGSFEVKDVAYDADGTVLRLWVTFTQYCGIKPDPCVGEFFYNMDAATAVRTTTMGALKARYR